ncbi:MAG TPA: glycosyltransferase [Vicinamibacteria bacterium]|jgi:beta-1,4-mannosyltransferase
MRAIVAVLGDLTRSPRMRYHALALARRAVDVDLTGYQDDETAVPDGDPRIRLRLLPAPFRATGHGAGYILSVAVNVPSQALALLCRILFTRRRPDVVLVQTPPAVPTLPVAWLAARLRGSRLVVDWHNLAYTLLALRLGRRHPLVTLAAFIERRFGRLADGHLCVSQALREALSHRWGLRGVAVLYDRSGPGFDGPRPERADEARRRVLQRIGLASAARPALVVSPTSWTLDEDFGLLLAAAERCEDLARQLESRPGARPFPDVVVLVTGRGPLRAAFEARVAQRTGRRIHVRTLWLSPEEYADVLAAADLGLSLHRSSSGLDLAMKVADMFACGLPVFAFDYGACLAEQVRHGVNGLVFASVEELAERLCEAFAGFPSETATLDRLRPGALASGRRRWIDEWNDTAAAVVLG